MQAELLKVDAEHIWHPFTQARLWDERDALMIERGEGHYLIDTEGRRYLDGVSSIWCNVHGHAVPELTEAINKQAAKFCHSTLLGLTHVPILELTEELLKICPSNLSRVFYSDSGTAAVEAGLRMALEWWRKSGAAEGRTKLASLHGAYHGDTLGAVSVGFLEEFHSSLKPVCTQAKRVRPPHWFRFFEGATEEQALERSIAELEEFFVNEGQTLAAFIVEPLVQGAAGIWIHPAEYLRAIKRLCVQNSVILIVDEVATGFIKTGAMFACELAEVEPDILILGKSLSGGYLPISAAVTTEDIYRGFIGEPSELKTFFYGQTFAGNALAAAVSVANLKLIRERDPLATMPQRSEYLGKLLSEHVAPLPCVDEIRRLGFMVGIELTQKQGEHKPYSADLQIGRKIVLEARERGVIVRPIGNVLVLMPAVTMNESELAKLVQVTAEAISSVTQ